jgi:hypothetical protein
MVEMCVYESVFVAQRGFWQSSHQNAFSPSSVSGWKKLHNFSGKGELESVAMCKEISCVLCVVVVFLLQ